MLDITLLRAKVEVPAEVLQSSKPVSKTVPPNRSQ